MRHSSEAAPEAPGLCLVQILANVVEEVRVSIRRDINGADLLYSLLNAPWLQSLLKVYECLQQHIRDAPRPFLPFASGISQEVMVELCSVPSPSPAARELYGLLRDAHLQALLSAHDAVAQKDYGPILPPLPDNLPDDEEAMRIVCLVKNKQPLRIVGGPPRSRWEKLRRLTKEKLAPAQRAGSLDHVTRRAGSLDHVTRGATARRGSYASPDRLRAPPPSQPRPLPLYTSASGCSVCRQSSALWDDGLYHSAPSVCGPGLMGHSEDVDSGEENGRPLSPQGRRSLAYQPFSVGSPCCSGAGALPPGWGGYGHAHTAPPSPMRPRRAEPRPHPPEPRPPAPPAERRPDDVRALGQKMVAATEMMQESVQENAQALGLLVDVVEKLRLLIAARRPPSYATPPAHHACFLSSSSSCSSSSSVCLYADSPALSPKTTPKKKVPSGHATTPPHLSNGMLGARPAANHSKTGCFSDKKEKKKKK